jgi:hypothetical protein
MEERRYPEAVAVWGQLAGSDSLEAEVANFRQAELQLRQLHLPQEALATLEAGQTRFPSGNLRQERQLSAIEVCVKMGRWVEVEARTAQFLREHPKSERRVEVQVLHASALGVLGKVQSACEELQSIPAPASLELRNRFNCP